MEVVCQGLACPYSKRSDLCEQTVVGGNDDGGGEHANRLAASEARAKVRGGNTDGPTGVCCGLLLIHQKGFPHPSYTQEAF